MGFTNSINHLWDARLASLGLTRRRSRLAVASTLIGVGAAGALIGAAVTALLVPTTGQATRAKLARLARLVRLRGSGADPQEVPPAHANDWQAKAPGDGLSA